MLIPVAGKSAENRRFGFLLRHRSDVVQVLDGMFQQCCPSTCTRKKLVAIAFAMSVDQVSFALRESHVAACPVKGFNTDAITRNSAKRLLDYELEHYRRHLPV